MKYQVRLLVYARFHEFKRFKRLIFILSKMYKTRSDILQGQALFRGVKQRKKEKRKKRKTEKQKKRKKEKRKKKKRKKEKKKKRKKEILTVN